MTVSAAALAALTSIELREAELLAWGAASAQWTEQEILEVVSGHGPARPLVDELADQRPSWSGLRRTGTGVGRPRPYESWPPCGSPSQAGR